MNNKIKSLIKECTTIEREFYDNGLGCGYYEDEVFDKEKFAELIIKECINTVITAYRGHINPKIVIESINQHFGIEEEIK